LAEEVRASREATNAAAKQTKATKKAAIELTTKATTMQEEIA